jgi:4-hydroxy-tetrahydrodipicolinate synthase
MGYGEFRGVLALLTKYYPCDSDGAIDESAYRKHIRWLLAEGVHGIGVGCGADFDYTDAERRKMAEILLEEAGGRALCFVGVSAPDTATAVKRAREAAKIGADVIFVTGPPCDRPLGRNVRASIVDHFNQVSEAAGKPTSFYNTPGAWPGLLDSETLWMIEEGCPLVKYVKAGPREMREYYEMVAALQGRRLRIIAGKSYYNFHQLNWAWRTQARPVGVCGYLVGLLPKEHVLMWNAFEAGAIEEARRIWVTRILPLADLLYGRAFGYNEKLHPLEVLKQLGLVAVARTPFSVEEVDEYMRGELVAALGLIGRSVVAVQSGE